VTITQNQRKWMWISAIAVAVYYTPAVVNMAMQSANQRQVAQTPVTPAPSKKAPNAPAPALHYLLGQYQGREILPTRGACVLRFELRDNRDAPGKYSGYYTLTCTPLSRLDRRRWMPDMAASMMLGPKPTSPILTGTADGGAIHFQVDDTVSGGCAPTEITVKPFGATQIAVQWHDSCRGGSMLLTKAGR